MAGGSPIAVAIPWRSDRPTCVVSNWYVLVSEILRAVVNTPLALRLIERT